MSTDEMYREDEKYACIIKRNRHRSERRAPMPVKNRAAQFAPFAALTGYEEEIRKATEEHILKVERKI